jgi:hypothetical protein
MSSLTALEESLVKSRKERKRVEEERVVRLNE